MQEKKELTDQVQAQDQPGLVKPVLCFLSLQLEVEEGSSGVCKATSEAQDITISWIQLDQFIVILSLH